MKPLLLCVVVSIFLIGCIARNSKVKLPAGIYVNQSESEFSIANDTVILKPEHDDWIYVRHLITYKRKLDHGFGPVKYSNTEFRARFQSEDKVVVNPRNGNRYSFPDVGGKLIYNGTMYLALKD
ncbi:hypothetical protein SAMN05444008_105208 [Cnuella takakiae]|uniref:Uncharacterized protein n=1 Tax=Cnuella takakiae TaxID=1302690 RepID=A0A1M4ZH06_9BACT|nr:hypothetical protein [Cnuella takakiae]OLY94222.1 hypothetical protein BUE76_21795 [Cnuella takakiae]SHF16876.1 hypothetical protein SAMN05444008_105208 [Cnuella takakiae]